MLPVIAGLEADFEAPFARTQSIISARPGFLGLTLSRSLERPGTCLLPVDWETLADHVVGFRGSPEYAQWSRLPHRFHAPFPEAGHLEPVASAAAGQACAAHLGTLEP
nr:antibiotic biosynthesis monooxygenase [Arthrobacter wenxiniae]